MNRDRIESDRRLIMKIVEHPLLYDKKIPGYRQTGQRERSWKQLGLALNRPASDCKRRWKGLRDTFGLCHRNELNGFASAGSGPTNSCKWVHYQSMMFLLPYLSKLTKQNLSRSKTKQEPTTPTDEEDTDDECLLERTEHVRSPNIQPHERASQKWSTPAPYKRRKEEPEDLSGILDAISSSETNDVVLPPPPQNTNQLFFAAIASQAEELTPRQQSQLRLKVLQTVNQIQYGDDSDPLD